MNSPNMKYILFLFALVTSHISMAQKYCGFDNLRELHLNSHSHAQEDESIINDLILTKILEYNESGSRGGGEGIVVPVVVHVIHQNGDENISDEAIFTGIEQLNQAFSNTGPYFDPNGVNTQISFCLAQTDPDNEITNGINRVFSDLTDMIVPNQELELKDLIRWDPLRYLNIWIVKEITRDVGNSGVIGFSSFPDIHGEDLDGVVSEAQFFGASTDGSGVHIHEIGHYLGLYHTFQDGCPNEDCLTEGDRVCDTPPDSHVFNAFCFDGTNSCLTDEDDESDNNPFRPISLGGSGDQEDMQDNFMDYSSLLCFSRFTAGQADRMYATLTEIRSTLLDQNLCNPPCDDPIEVDVEADNLSILVGESVSFDNNSNNSDENVWSVNGEEISNSVDFMFQFDESGVNVVELYMSNAVLGCAETVIFEVVVECPITSDFTSTGTSFQEGEEVLFTNTSEDATNFNWLVDGVTVSNDENLIYTFDDPGGYSIQLITSNGDCEVYSHVLFVSAGFCSTGKENNIWHFFNGNGNFYGFDFNQSEDNIDFNTNNLNESGHCKSTLCDQNGNLLWISTGERLLDKNYNLTPNGDSLLGNSSSHFGSIMIQAPESDDLYYLFTADADENSYLNGVRYSIIDKSLNSGLGDINEVKNEFLEITESETLSTVRHCNLTDFWLVFYDLEEGVYKSYLVDSEGISENPVVSEYSQTGQFLYRMDLRVSPRGDQIVHNNLLFDFDQSTGVFDLVHDFNFEFVESQEFSPNGKVLYFETGLVDVLLRQFDLSLPIEEAIDNQFILDLDDIGDVGFDMKLASDGRIYKEEIVTGNISVIEFPNLIGESMSYDDNAYQASTIINTFGNFHHGYIGAGGIEISGPDTVCLAEMGLFEVFGYDCILNAVHWQANNALFTEIENGIIELSFNESGYQTIQANLETECGFIETEFQVFVKDLPELDLGPDMAICDGIPLELSVSDVYDEYLWSNEEQDNAITINLAGTYTLEVSQNGCSNQDSIEIGPVVSPELELGNDVALCNSDILLVEIPEQWIDPVWQDGAETNLYTIYEGGTYSVVVTLPCAVSDELVVTDCDNSIVNLNELNYDSIEGILIYPNPSSDKISVSYNFKGPEVIRVYNSLGQLCLRRPAESMNMESNHHIQIDVTTFAPGVYTLEIEGQFKKFTVQ